MIVVLGLWLVVIGYGLAYLGVDKFSGGNKSFGEVFLPTFLTKKAAA